MDIANFSIEILTFLFFVGVVAGFLDTLVGGGGLLAVPALLLSGITPIYVLGTNKFQVSIVTGIATFLLFLPNLNLLLVIQRPIKSLNCLLFQ